MCVLARVGMKKVPSMFFREYKYQCKSIVESYV